MELGTPSLLSASFYTHLDFFEPITLTSCTLQLTQKYLYSLVTKTKGAKSMTLDPGDKQNLRKSPLIASGHSPRMFFNERGYFHIVLMRILVVK